MKIHHLNCISSCPLGGALTDGVSRSSLRGRLTNHCLLLETATSLILVDTGFGLRDVADPRTRLAPFFRELLKPDLRVEMTAFAQIESLGFDARDVRHIVLSHLDFDHAGGLDDFPHARVHLMAVEEASAAAQRTWLDRMRYREQQWSSRDRWITYSPDPSASWMGFESVRNLDGITDEIMLIPLPGHTMGHAGVAIRRANDWLLYAADAYFFHAEMAPVSPHCPVGLRQYQTLMEKDRRLRLGNQRRLRRVKRTRNDVEIFCAHDVTEFERLAGRAHSDPVDGGPRPPLADAVPSRTNPPMESWAVAVPGLALP